MALNEETVRRIATLARIRVPNQNLEPLADELNNILGWIEQLSEVDTDTVQPMTSVIETVAPQRADIVTDGGDPDKVLHNAPQAKGAFYTVPKVVE